MTLIQSIKTCFQKYANFNGRAMRSEYWWFQLFMIVISYAAMAMDHLFLGYTFESAVTPLAAIAMVVLTVPSAAVTARRLHDIGWSGWVQLPMYITFSAYLDVWIPNFSLLPLGFGLMMAGIVFWIILCLILIKDGQPQTNKYGPNPKSPNMGQVFN